MVLQTVEAIEDFFDCLTDEETDCMNINFPLQRQVRIFLEENFQQTLERAEAPVANPEDFARLAIKAVCAGQITDLNDEKVIDFFDITEEVPNA